MKNLLSLLLLISSMFVTADEGGKKVNPKIVAGEEALPGYWAVDEEFLLKSMLKDAAKGIESGLVTEETLKEKASEYSKMMLIYFSDQKKTVMHTMAGKKEGAYEVTATRPAKNEVDVTVSSKDFGAEKSTLFIKGDTLKMSGEGQAGSMQFKRVPEKEVPGRIAHIENLKEKK